MKMNASIRRKLQGLQLNQIGSSTSPHGLPQTLISTLNFLSMSYCPYRLEKLMSLWKLFGIESQDAAPPVSSSQADTVTKITAALDELPIEQARFLACYAYILSRVAHADQYVSEEETQVMESLIVSEGQLPKKMAVLIVQMAKTQNVLFGGIENYVVTRELNKIANRKQKMSLLHCLYAVSAANQSISNIEDSEIRQVTRELKLRHQDFISARLHFKKYLEILKPSPSPKN